MIRCRDGCHIFRCSVYSPPTLLTGLYLKKMVSEIAGRRSSLSVFLSDTSCRCTVYGTGWEALGGGGVWSLWRCKNPSHFLWWYARIPRAASRAPFLPQPSPSLSSHQPSAAPAWEGNRVEVTELRFEAQRRKRPVKKNPDFHVWILFYLNIKTCRVFKDLYLQMEQV